LEKRLWDNIWLRLVVFVVLAAVLLWFCYILRQILIPLTLAFIVAYIFDPVIDVLEKRKIPRAISIAILLVLILVILAGSLLIVIPKLVQESIDFVQSFQESFPAIEKKVAGLVGKYSDSALAERFQTDMEAMLGQLQEHVPQMLQALQGVLVSIASRTAGIVGSIINFLLFAVVSVYLLKDFDTITEKARELIPPARRDTILTIMGKIDVNLRGFFRGQILVCTILAAIYFVGLSIVGVPFAYLIALLGGYGQIVPYLGTALGIVPAVLLALVEHGDLVHPIGALVVFAIGQTAEGFFITPKIVGDQVGLHPVVIIIAILVFANLLGFLGVLFAVPLAAVLKVMLDEALARYKQSTLFSGSDT